MKDYLAQAESLREPLTAFLSDLVKTPSLSKNEGAVVERIRREMETLEYDEIIIDPLGNILGRIGNGKRIIAIDGHIDTVDVGDPSQWDRDPFSGAVEDGILYGRGASDMKGGVASAVYAGGMLKKSGLPPDVTVYVTGTVQEEDCDGMPWDYIIQKDALRPDVVIITEPTGLCIYRGHRGRIEIEVSTTGLSAHGSAPERGVNAVYKMAPIVLDIEALNDRLPPRDPLGKGTVTISEIRSQSPSQCAVADGCTIHLDRRLTIGENEETSVGELQALESVQKAGAEIVVLQYEEPSYTGLVYPFKKYFPTWEFPETHPCVRTAVEAYRAVLGTEPEVGHWTFSTNGVATAGLHGIPTVGLGPGYEHFAHAPNEQVEVDQLVKAAAFYAGYVEAF